jgi:hypothetical protein
MELRPSTAYRWANCAGYSALNEALGQPYVEEVDNEIREDGIAAHWFNEQAWSGARPAIGSLAPNGREITEEMSNGCDEYHAMLRSWGVEPTLEQPVPVSRYFPGVSAGTPDAWGYRAAALTLHVGDYKYGYRAVEVWRNAQMIIYAWTICCELTASGEAPQHITLTICQPRCAHRDGTTRSWTVGIRDLAVLAADLAERAKRCYAPQPLCKVGPWCHSCSAAFGCRTLQSAAAGAAEISYDATPFELNEQQLGYELSRLMTAQAHLEHRITGLSTQAESLLRKGKRIPAFELGRKGTRWRWRSGSEAIVRRLGELFGVEVMQEPKLKTVAKLRDAFPIDVQAMYAEKPDGEMTLRMTDPNEAIKRFEK